MKTLPLVRGELARVWSSKMGRLSLIALMTTPLFYGGLYLWGNQDPYGNLDQVPAALVVADTGASVDGAEENYGRDAATALLDDGTFGWHEVTESEAQTGVRNGTYDFALEFPASFSTDLASASTDAPTRASLVLTTNDANSYLSTTIAKQAAATVRTSIAQQVGETATSSLLSSIADIRDGIVDASDGASKLASGAADAANGAADLASGSASLASGASQLAVGATKASTGATSLSTGARSVNAGAKSLAQGTATLATGAASLSSGLATLDSSVGGLPASTSELATGADQVSTGASAAATGASSLSSGASQVSGSIPALRAGVEQALAASALTPTQKQQILDGFTALQAGASSVATGASTLSGSLGTLSSGAAQVASGADALSASAPALADGVHSAATGAATVATGATSAASGASDLHDGTKQLASGASTLSSGAASVASGAEELSAGAASASTGATQLADGTTTLSDGATKLSDSLASAQDQIPAQTSSEQQTIADAVADPAAVHQKAITEAANYGAGLAPFFVSLAAWIGIYALFLILRPLSRRALTAVNRPFRATLAGWLAPAVLGTVQMVALFGILTLALRLPIANPAGVLLFMALTSVTFAAIILALNALLGSVGQFLGLILMLIQLVTAGGTFPWQTLPGPLAAIHQVLPMAHAVDGIRSLMYGGSTQQLAGAIVVLLVWLVAALAATVFAAFRQARWRTLREVRPAAIGG